jgi:uncharacterized protein YndB with AHSA1/START domain
MKIDPRSDHATDEASAKAATGRTLGEWFALLDAFGGPGKGRRDIGNHLLDVHKLDPWWVATINIAYEAAHGLLEKDGRPKGYTICATKSIKVSADACHAAFASAEALDRWLGPQHELDFAEGGELRNADGNRAALRKISPGKVIRLVWREPVFAADTPVEVKFQPNPATTGPKTTVMITHERLQDRAAADGFRRAWGEALDRLKTLLER